jgi:hypothetical protein
VSCSWCVSPYRQAAEEALGEGMPVTQVCQTFGLSRDQWRHHKGHGVIAEGSPVPLATVRAEVLNGGGGPYTVIPRLEELISEVQTAKTEWVAKPSTVLGFMRLERDLLGDVAKLRGEFPQKHTVSVGELAEWRIVLDALRVYPNALRAVSAALTQGDAT